MADYIGAIEDYDHAIILEPANAATYLCRGIATSSLGNNYESLTDFDKVLELNPTGAEAALAFANRAIVNFNLGKIPDAFIDCEEALFMQCDMSLVYHTVGRLYYGWNGEMEKAICCFRIALLLAPEDSQYLFRLANCYDEWDEHRMVEDDFFKFLGKYGETAKNYYVDENAFKEKNKIAQGFYSRAFIGLMPVLRTDLDDTETFNNLYLFIGNNKYILDPIEKKSFHFADTRSFSDKTDCPLLNPINQTNLAAQITFQNVRIRCLCNLEGSLGIEMPRSIWDRYANGHKGLAYKLKIKKEWLLHHSLYTNKVTYTTSEMHIKTESPEQVIEDGLFQKDVGYIDEREWRIIKFGDYSDQEGIEVSWAYNGKMGVEIEAIYLGENISAEIKEKIFRRANEEKIPLYKVMVAEKGMLKSIPVDSW